MLSSNFTFLFSILFFVCVWDWIIIYQLNKRSIYDYFKFFVFVRCDNWWSYWGCPWADLYCLHNLLCECQNLQTSKTMVKSWCILNSPRPIPVQVSDYCVCRILKTLKTNKNSFLVWRLIFNCLDIHFCVRHIHTWLTTV